MKLFLDTSGRENFSTPHHSPMTSRDLEERWKEARPPPHVHGSPSLVNGYINNPHRRYGFINPTYLPSTPTDPAFKGVLPQATYSRAFAPPKRISTALHLHSTTPQKRTHALHLRLSPFSNPAPEMLRSPLPGASAALREKEHTRAKKWRDMAVVRKRSERGDEAGRGGGCEWAFVTRDPKLVSRTWKGIPDCWRAAAWHAFLTASAKRRGIGRGDAELIEIYAVGFFFFGCESGNDILGGDEGLCGCLVLLQRWTRFSPLVEGGLEHCIRGFPSTPQTPH